ncbi:hypothetical protein [Psychroserpens mesophilus]|uniref:hypothetical protein n=1 Tax=Psychroserpens mesophilus TaxID=325473 RepID=UPI00058C4E69|nr:hypothetical protein [Psychroserpens mesophilus]
MKNTIFIFLILILSCDQNKKTQKTEINEKSELNSQEFDYVILDYQPKWYWIFKDAQQSELTQSELNEIEEILKVMIKENNDIQKKRLAEHNKTYPEHPWTETRYELKLEGYKRQYVPIINKNGQKIVWINFLCDDFGTDDWKNQLFEVEDGGNCYYNVKINLNRKEYYELGINGSA